MTYPQIPHPISPKSKKYKNARHELEYLLKKTWAATNPDRIQVPFILPINREILEILDQYHLCYPNNHYPEL